MKHFRRAKLTTRIRDRGASRPPLLIYALKVVAFVALAFTYGGQAMAQHSSEGFSMDRFRWNNRPLVVFAPSVENDDYVEQLRRLEDAARELADRDMVVIHALDDTGPSSAVGGRIELFDTSSPRRETLSAGAVASLRDTYGVGEQEYAVLLIGKDGGVKLRSAEPVSTAALFSLIDSMPMRRREMRESEKE
ncbi:MAG: DUF4174 domain-containing protein [Spirochaetes bacterium]|jgi:hypothetical protein|nr:DUF4174 domain-containing protein [Spirochaetota bacterium]